MKERRAWAGRLVLLGLAGLALGSAAQAQTQSASVSPFGMSYLPQTSLTGSPLGQTGVALMPLPMPLSTQPGANGAAAYRAMDPLGLGYVYGPAAVPMTPGQAGLFMLSTSQRMLGLGNGQLSGVRPADPSATAAARRANGKPEALASAAHTRNANIPGGQAARYFNRGSTPATARSQPYYHRQLRYFPQTGQ
jgi:hypothetical protein